MKDGVYQKELSTHTYTYMAKKSKQLPDIAELKEYLDYDPDSGLFTWTKLRSKYCNMKVGDVAGSVNQKGYIRIKFNGDELQAHRLAWLFHYGVDPGEMDIDHENGNRTDNRISNLRLATFQQNVWNRVPKGYKERNGKFYSLIKIKGKETHLGVFDCPLLAHLAHMAKRKELYGQWCRA